VLEVLAQQEVHPLLHEHLRLLPELLLHVGLGHPGEVGGALGQATEGEGAALLGDIEGEGLHHDGPALRTFLAVMVTVWRSLPSTSSTRVGWPYLPTDTSTEARPTKV